MKTKLIFSLLVFALAVFISCKKDDVVTVTVEASDLTVTIDENPTFGQVIGTVIGTTNVGSVSFSINTQTPSGAFVIDASSGELYVSDERIFDFETNPLIAGVVRVSNGDVFKDVDIIVTLRDIDETITVDPLELNVTIVENPANDFLIGNIYATTNYGTLTFSFLEQTPNDAFKFSEENVPDGKAIIVDDEELFDFETNPVITGIVRVSNGEVYKDINIQVTLSDTEGIITVDPLELNVTIDENPTDDFLIGNISATTNDGTLTFTFLEQTPNDAFKFSEESVPDGKAIIVDDETLFDFEINPIITGIVRVSNGDLVKDVNIQVTLNDIYEPIITELANCTDCRSLAVRDDYLYISKLNSIYKMNVNDNTGELIEVYSGSESLGSITFVDDYLYTLWGQRIGRIDVMNANPTWELFYQGNFLDFYDEPYIFSSLTANGTDLYFGVYCDDCDAGNVWKINTIGTPVINFIGIIGRHNISMVFNNSYLYTISVSVGFDLLRYQRINLVTFENDYIYSEYDYTGIPVIASKENYIYTTYERDIYRFNTEGAFNQELIYDFEDTLSIKGMVFSGDNLYYLRYNKLNMMSLE